MEVSSIYRRYIWAGTYRQWVPTKKQKEGTAFAREREKERKRGGGKEGGGRKEGKKCQSLLGKWLCNFIQLLQYETYVAAINDKAIWSGCEWIYAVGNRESRALKKHV